ncbi:MAG: DUF6443 domain-containing protein [Chryseolinea sp.]
MNNLVKYIVLLCCVLVASVQAKADCINGVLTVCPGETQTYTLGETFYKRTWSITGGTKIAGGTQSTDYVTVQWSTVGTQSITVSELLAEYAPHTCSINVSVKTATGGGVTPASSTVCDGGTANLTLGGHYGSVTRWEKSTNGTTWQTIANTATTYNTGALSQTTYFRAVVSACSATAYSASATVNVSVPVAGSVSLTGGGGSFCTGESASGTLTASSYDQTVANWEKSEYVGGSWGGWVTISGSGGATYNFSVNVSTRFRTRVTKAGCSAYSGYVTISEIAPTVAGYITGTTQVCSGATFSLSVTGQNGNIIGWYMRDAQHGWGAISSGTNISISQSSYFKARVQSSSCTTYKETPEYSVSVIPLPTGGSVTGTTNVCQGSGSTLTLSGHAGTIVRWERKIGTGNWENIANTSAIYNTGALTQAVSYRAVVANSCSQTVASSSVSINVQQNQPGSVSLESGQLSFCAGESAAGTLRASNYAGNLSGWEKREYVGGSWGSWSFAGGGSGDLFNYSVTIGTQFRTKISAGVCGTIYSDAFAISETAATVAGYLTGPTDVCAGTTFNISIQNNVGSVQSWWTKDSTHDWTQVPSVTSISISRTSSFKALVQNSGCTSPKETAPITVNTIPAPTVGTLNSNLLLICEGETSTLQLSGFTGAAIQWQQRLDGDEDFVTIETNTSLSYPLPSVTAEWRGLVVNSCGVEKSSAVAMVKVLPKPQLPVNSTDQWMQSSSTAILSAYSREPGTTVNWYDTPAATGVPIATQEPIASSSVLITPILYAPTDFYARAVNSVGCYSDVLTVSSQQLATMAMPPNSQMEVARTEVATQEAFDQLSVSDKHKQSIYFDGLGRNIQTVTERVSPSGGFLVQPVEYDRFGRTPKTYLPYVAGYMADGFYPEYRLEQAEFYNANEDAIANDANPFAVTVFDDSPLERVIEQGSAGVDYQPGTTHTQRFEYTFNDVSDNVRKFNADGSSTGYWSANNLTKNISTNPDGNQSIIFKDGRGLTVLKRVQLDEIIDGVLTAYLDTYYVFNELGQVVYTISPKGVHKLKGNGWMLTSTIKEQFVFESIYDSYGRLIEQKEPGKASMFFVYDDLGRLVLTQDGLLRSDNKWLFVKYDRKGRPVMRGLYKDAVNNSRSSIQDIVSGLYSVSNSVYGSDSWYETRGTVHGYSQNSFPKTNQDNTPVELLTVNYYDNHDFDNNGTADYTYLAQGLAGESAQAESHYGRATGSKRLVLGSSIWLRSYVFYDDRGRSIQTRSDNHLSQTCEDVTTLAYNFENQVLFRKTYHKAGVGKETTVLNSFYYDATGRLTKVQQQNNSDAIQTIATYQYNELGQLIDKKLHDKGGEDFLQSIDYRYSIKGQVVSINNASLTMSSDNDDDDDYFGLELLYGTSEYGINNIARYDGNITAMKWKGLGDSPGYDMQHNYRYLYDKTGKLENAGYQKDWDNDVGMWDETMKYDHNGNMLALQRSHRAAGAVEKMDDLTYSYSTGDQLSSVQDVASSIGGFLDKASEQQEFTYDVNGNTISDKNKGITHIDYNFLGKPSLIALDNGGTISYTYDAVGNKLTVSSTKGNVTRVTDYANGFVYENQELAFFGSPEGRIVRKGNNLVYEYSIADHQGNTRVVFASEVEQQQTGTDFEDDSSDILEDDVHLSTLPIMNNTAGGTTSQLLTGGVNSRVGAARSIKVYPGDKIKAEVVGKYWDLDRAGDMGDIVTSLIGAFGLSEAVTGEMYQAFLGLNNAGAWMTSDGREEDDEEGPKGFVTVLLFDKDYNFIDAGWDKLDENFSQNTNLSNKDAFDHLEVEMTVKSEGYAYIFVSNEHPTPLDIHFDDFKVTHTPSNVVQYNEYYPFGLQTENSWTREDAVANQFLYNSGSELNDSTQWYEMFYRDYDPALGRMLQLDPLASVFSSVSGYNYALNNPVMMNDPMGDRVESDLPDYVDWNSFDGGPTRIGPGSGNHWSDSYGSYAMMSHNAFMVRSGQMSVQTYSSQYGAVSFGGGLQGLTRAMMYTNQVKIGASDNFGTGQFTYTFGGKTYGGQYYTENGVVTGSATSEIIQHSSGAWEAIGETSVTEWNGNGVTPGWFSQFGEFFETDYNRGVVYDGDAWYGSNFIGPGSSEDPYTLEDERHPGQVLKPKDMVDAAAQRHDYFYFLAKADGVSGALFATRVKYADQLLAAEAAKAYFGYFRGEIDPITHNKISPRTRDVAFDIMVTFSLIGSYKSKF